MFDYKKSQNKQVQKKKPTSSLAIRVFKKNSNAFSIKI